VSVAARSPRSEPLLWLQLLGLGVLPLEALLLMLLLAAGDPGPLPALERLLCWAIGSLAPAFLLWRRPADGWSLLLVQVPLRGRRELQNRLSTLVTPPALQAGGLLLGCSLSLLLLWWCDGHAAVVSAFSPVSESPRLVGLLLAASLLALLQWQWQQVVQALWWLTRSTQQVDAAAPLAPSSVERERLSLGIPLLILSPLLDQAPTRSVTPPASTRPFAEADVAPERPDPSTFNSSPEIEPSREAELRPTAGESDRSARDMDSGHEEPPLVEAEDLAPVTATNQSPAVVVIRDGSKNPVVAAIPEVDLDPDVSTSVAATAVPIEPEQPAEDQQRGGLDQQIG